jgi:hypothetical protein
MPQIFGPSANSIARVVLICLIVAPFIVIGMGYGVTRSQLRHPRLDHARPARSVQSTLCRAHWVRNDPVPRAAGCYATTTQFLRELREAMRQRASIRDYH